MDWEFILNKLCQEKKWIEALNLSINIYHGDILEFYNIDKDNNIRKN